MNTMYAKTRTHFYRDADRAVLGGVCAGLAAYLGFNLKMTRFLAFIAFLMAMPIAVVGYLAAVFLIPSESRRDEFVRNERCESRRSRKRHKKNRQEPSRHEAAAAIDRRCRTLDERLIQLEKVVTSSRFQLNQELSKL